MLNKVIFSKKIMILKLWLLLLIIFKCQARDLGSNSRRMDNDDMSRDSFKLHSANNVAEVPTQRSQMESDIHNNISNFVGTEVKENWDTREPKSIDERTAENSQQKYESKSNEKFKVESEKKPNKKRTLWSRFINNLYYSSGKSALEENRKKGVGHLFEDLGPIESTYPEPLTYRLNSPKQQVRSTVQAESVIEPTPNAQVEELETISQNPPSNEHIELTPKAEVVESRIVSQNPPSDQHIEPIPKAQDMESQPNSQNPPSNQHTVQPPHRQNQSTKHEQKQNENLAPIVKVKKVHNPFPTPENKPYVVGMKMQERTTKLQGAEQTERTIECCAMNNCKLGSSCGCGAGACMQGGCCICCLCCNAWLTAAFWADLFARLGNKLGLC